MLLVNCCRRYVMERRLHQRKGRVWAAMQPPFAQRVWCLSQLQPSSCIHRDRSSILTDTLQRMERRRRGGGSVHVAPCCIFSSLFYPQNILHITSSQTVQTRRRVLEETSSPESREGERERERERERGERERERERERGRGRERLVKKGQEERQRGECLSALPADTTCQLDVFGHDGDTFGVDGAQVGVLKQTHQSSDGSTLETQIGLEVLGDFSHQTLEGQLADQQLSGLLVTTDLTQSHGTGPSQHINVRLSPSGDGGGLMRKRDKDPGLKCTGVARKQLQFH
ncbi:hypothetical protein F7725_021085 [Dissostichus mawsoni]|uniref:Uncharacterized protein n=1 Tax=Dissostichus mawsoni TaxID=36200 RepID=A0A7J5YHS7_DISMA|nr:hypothetical protein F7725_021085 [Dissostichus mawsoni]